MSEDEPCKVLKTEVENPPAQPCDEATYLFCIFYLGLAKDLAFFLAGLRTEDFHDAPQRLRVIFLQYLALLCFFACTSAVAAVLYAILPTDHLPRRVLYIALGTTPNLAIVLDCMRQMLTARRKGCQVIFPEVQEIKPDRYDLLMEKSWSNTWYLKECLICLDSFEGPDSVVQLPCGHVFHTHCVVDWLKQNMTCPVRCRLGFFFVTIPGGELTHRCCVHQDTEASAAADGNATAEAISISDPHPLAVTDIVDVEAQPVEESSDPDNKARDDDDSSTSAGRSGNEVLPVMLGVPEATPPPAVLVD